MTKKDKLFIFSNTYIARILLRYIEHINNNGFEIVLLSELGVSNNVNVTIEVYETLQQCIEECTQVLVVRNETMPKSKIDLVVSLANSQNKHCTIVDEIQDTQNSCYGKDSDYQNIKDRPLVLIISYGSKTQLSCWETIIYKLLCNNKFKALQSPSDELNNVINWLSLCNLNNDFYNIVSADAKCEVVVKSLQYDPNASDEFDKLFYKLKPDVVIVSICNNYYNYDEIRNIFKFRYGCIIDIFAKSELLEIIDEDGKQKLIFNFSPFINGEYLTAFLNDPLLMKHLSKVIIPKIALPDGVTII